MISPLTDTTVLPVSTLAVNLVEAFIKGVPNNSKIPVTAIDLVPVSEKSSIIIGSEFLFPVKLIVIFPGNGYSAVPAINLPPLTQILVALITTSAKLGSILRAPSIIKVPKVTVGVSNSIVHSQGIITSSPSEGVP